MTSHGMLELTGEDASRKRRLFDGRQRPKGMYSALVMRMRSYFSDYLSDTVVFQTLEGFKNKITSPSNIKVQFDNYC